MRVLIVSHAYVELANHQKLVFLSRQPGLEIGVVYPRRWRTWHGEVKDQKSIRQSADKDQKPLYRQFALGTFWGGDGGKYFYNPVQLIASIRAFKPDLIHLEEEPFSIVSGQLSIISWLLGWQLTFFTWENISDLKLGLIRFLVERLTLVVSRAALAGSSGAKQRLEALGFRKKIEIVSQFGVDLDLFHPEPAFGSPPSTVIGFVGRPTLAKGIDLLLEALAKLPETYKLLWATTARVIPESMRSQIKALQIGDRVEINLGVDYHNLPQQYRRMSIFVLPSRTTPTWKEQFGRTLLEAMACGVPVIGSSSGAIPEVVGEAGLIFDEGNSESLRAKILELLSLEKRNDLSEKGHKRVEDLFSSRVVTQKTVDFFRRLV